MKLSYIIPVYNCGQYLHDCIASIEKTGFRDYEVILVDDGSTDGSDWICDSIEKSNDKVRCFHQSNQGVSAARNAGLKHALGEYVMFVDADDTLNIKHFSDVLKTLLIVPTADMIIFGLSFDYYYHKRIYRRDVLETPIDGLLEQSTWLPMWKDLFYSNSLSPIWNKIIRRKILIDNNIWFDENMIVYEDLVYSLKALSKSEYVYFYPKVVYHYRQSDDEGNAGRRIKKIDHLATVVDTIDEAFGQLIDSLENKSEKNKILLDIYISLLRAKIGASNKKEIVSACTEFKDWYLREGNVHETNEYVDLLMNANANKIICERKKSNIRHQVAIRVKNSYVYKKWRKEEWT